MPRSTSIKVSLDWGSAPEPAPGVKLRALPLFSAVPPQSIAAELAQVGLWSLRRQRAPFLGCAPAFTAWATWRRARA